MTRGVLGYLTRHHKIDPVRHVFVLAGYRTQLFNAGDVDNVLQIQAGYTVEPLSKFLGEPAPAAAPKIDFPPYIPEKAKTLAFFSYLNFLLQFCPTAPADQAARDSFMKIGVEPGNPAGLETLSPEIQKALEAGMAQGQQAIEHNRSMRNQRRTRFGTQEAMKNDYLNCATAAVAGIYGNSEDEAFYYAFYKDAGGGDLDGAKGNHTLHFDKDKFPPVHAFWSVMLYDGNTKLLSANLFWGESRFLLGTL